MALHSGSGMGKMAEQTKREIVRHHLGILSTETSSPESAIMGQLLIAYVNVTTRFLGKLEGSHPEDIKHTINRQLSVPDGESPQQTIERLLNIATNNSRKINSSEL